MQYHQKRLRYLADRCERCGFVPEHRSQLDLDHVVPVALGGKWERSNLQTLCANCHRLKTVVTDMPQWSGKNPSGPAAAQAVIPLEA